MKPTSRIAALGLVAGLVGTVFMGSAVAPASAGLPGATVDKRGGNGNGNGNGGGRRNRKPVHVVQRFRLQPTEAGAAQDLRGQAMTEFWSVRGSQPVRERLRVEVSSPTADEGTIMEVWIVNPRNTTDAVFLGNLTLVQDDSDDQVVGRLRLDTKKGDLLREGVSPVRRITEIRVVEPTTDEVLLESRRR